MDKIAILKASSTEPIEVSDEGALAEFDPWGRQFIDWDRGIADGPPPGGEGYMVSFYLDDRVIYVLEYAPDAAGGTGFIYIPGPDHPDYSLNSGTIIGASSDRWDPNGKWQYATPRWDALMRSESGVQPPATGDGGLR